MNEWTGSYDAIVTDDQRKGLVDKIRSAVTSTLVRRGIIAGTSAPKSRNDADH